MIRICPVTCWGNTKQKSLTESLSHQRFLREMLTDVIAHCSVHYAPAPSTFLSSLQLASMSKLEPKKKEKRKRNSPLQA